MRVPALLIAFSILLVACAQGSRRDRGRSDSDSDPADAGGPPPSMDGRDTGAPPGSPPDGGATLPDTDDGSGDDTPGDACTSAAECDDGLACNGVERCEAGSCVAGTPMVCDDGVSCTVDSCEEPGTCVYDPNDTLCGPSETCGASGCVSGCAESPCRLVSPQCGCSGGEGCYLTGSGERACMASGTAGEGETCSGLASCQAGTMCINVASSGTTTLCLRFCDSDSDCDPGSLCLHSLDDGSGGTLEGVRLCTRSCNVARQTGCPSDAFCELYQESEGSMRTFTDCAGPVEGTGTQGATCTGPEDCAAGYACIDPDGDGARASECLHWCEVASGTGCAAGGTCYGFSEPARVGGIEYGVCD